MQINENEIKCNVLHAADQKAQIEIEAQLNATTPEHIREILRGQGVDLRSLKGAVKKRMVETSKRRSSKAEYGNVIASAISALKNRIKELDQQKQHIENERNAITSELINLIEGSDIE